MSEGEFFGLGRIERKRVGEALAAPRGLALAAFASIETLSAIVGDLAEAQRIKTRAQEDWQLVQLAIQRAKAPN